MSFVDSNGLAVEQLELRHAAILDANTGLTWTNAEDRRRRQVGQLAASSTLCKKLSDTINPRPLETSRDDPRFKFRGLIGPPEPL